MFILVVDCAFINGSLSRGPCLLGTSCRVKLIRVRALYLESLLDLFEYSDNFLLAHIYVASFYSVLLSSFGYSILLQDLTESYKNALHSAVSDNSNSRTLALHISALH